MSNDYQINKDSFIKKNLSLIIVLVSILLIAFSAISNYNSFTTSNETVLQMQSKIDVMQQRRYDLIPNVVNSVKGYMSHESDIFKSIADARSKIGSSNKSEEKEGQVELDSAISRLLVISENYPELKANQQVSDLITELEGTENRIVVARSDYNEAVKSHNLKIKRFPASLWAKLFNVTTYEYYEAVKESNTAPTVNLNGD